MANYPNDRAHFGGIHNEYCNWYLSINSLTHYHDIPPVNIIIIIIMSSHHLFAIKDWDFFSTIVHGLMLIIFSLCDQYLWICRLNKSNRSIDWCVCVCVCSCFGFVLILNREISHFTWLDILKLSLTLLSFGIRLSKLLIFRVDWNQSYLYTETWMRSFSMRIS